MNSVRNIVKFICYLFFVFSFLSTTASAIPKLPALKIPPAPELELNSYILLDYTTGNIIAEQNANSRIEPASLTKIMTAYIAYKAIAAGQIHPEQEVTISEKAWRMDGSRMFVEVGKKVTIQDLLTGVVIQSGNDASIALAEAVAGTEDAFVDMMNYEAKLLSMENTHFVTATGLHKPEHYSSAYDLAKLSQALIKDFPDSYKMYKQKSYTYNGIKQYNRNRLLWLDEHVDGIKTGHTDSAGFCLAASGLKNGMRLISIVIGAKSEEDRMQQSKRLLSYGFRYYDTSKIYSAKQPIKEQKIWLGEAKELPVGLDSDLFVTIPRGRYEDIKAEFHMNSMLKAPIKENDVVGKLIISLDDKTLADMQVKALKSIEKGSIWTRMKDYVELSFDKWFEADNGKGKNI